MGWKHPLTKHQGLVRLDQRGKGKEQSPSAAPRPPGQQAPGRKACYQPECDSTQRHKGREERPAGLWDSQVRLSQEKSMSSQVGDKDEESS